MTRFLPDWRRLQRRLDRLAGCPDAAEDALQTALLRLHLYRSAHAVRAPEALLARTAANLARDARRRTRRQGWDRLDAFAETLSDDSPLQDEVLAARERLRMVQAVLGRMPERTRVVFLLHRVEGLKYREIAEQLAISVSAVEKHVARAVFLLVEAMHDLGPAE